MVGYGFDRLPLRNRVEPATILLWNGQRNQKKQIVDVAMINITIREEQSANEEILHLTHPTLADSDQLMERTIQTQLPRNLMLHVGHEETLLERVRHSANRTELVLAPVDLHRRNIQRRLREAQLPKNRLRFADPPEVGKRLLPDGQQSRDTIDRIDRLSMIQSLLAENNGLDTSEPTMPSAPQEVEQIRTVVETVTGFHPERLEAFNGIAGELSSPIDADSTEILERAVAVERALRQGTEKVVSDVEFVRRASQNLLRTSGTCLEAAFPDVERISLVGVSSLPAAHVDLLHAILEATQVPVHIHFRRGTGSYLSRRLPELLNVTEPGTVVFES
jgi:hypothetical protein